MVWIHKILFLGYKDIGKGVKFKKDNSKLIESKINELKPIQSIKTFLDVISFDNLAIKQLGLEDTANFDVLYQGEDGKFSFYIDAVEQKYALSSLHHDKMYPFTGRLNSPFIIKEMFDNLHNTKE